jgi:hypothetical protein
VLAFLGEDIKRVEISGDNAYCSSTTEVFRVAIG